MMISKEGRSRSRTTSLLMACVLFAAMYRCASPDGCEPGGIPSNPLSSNLVDYTKPASGSIIYKEDLTRLEVQFLRPVLKSSFQVADDIRLFEIINFWGPDREELPFPGDVETVITGISWNCPETACDRLALVIDPEAISSIMHYRIRILGQEPADPDQPGVRPETYISSPSGGGEVSLAHDVDVIIGIGLMNPFDVPELTLLPPMSDADCLDEDSNEFDSLKCYVKPHKPLIFPFSSLMGFVAFEPHPIMGLNFGFSTFADFQGRESTLLWSDSKQGLTPGEHYTIYFPAEELDESKGIPRTANRLGNPLVASVKAEFNTSHVRIMLPMHEPYFDSGDRPDLWFEQGQDPDNLFFIVEATPDVRVLRDIGPDEIRGDVHFESVPLTSGNLDNSFHVIFADEIVRGTAGCPSNLQIHAYGAGGRYLGGDEMRVFAYQPPERILIVTYNANTHNDNWETRIDRFIQDIVVPYQPAIIAVQEVYLDSSIGCAVCQGGESISKGDYMKHLVGGINAALGRYDQECGHYYTATTVKSGHALLCIGSCEEWEGEAIIYDERQVRHVRTEPRPGDENYGCLEWYEGQELHYMVFMSGDVYNDCMTTGDVTNAEVSRAVFEFPLHSSCYFSLYNTHLSPCDIPETIQDYIIDRQETFRVDLQSYLLDKRRASEAFWIYPPIYAGDMNTYEGWDTDCGIDKEQEVFHFFKDAPGDGPIDKVWVGEPEAWTHDIALDVVPPPQPPEMERDICHLEKYPPFYCRELGYYFLGDTPYSDHSPSMVEVEQVSE